MTILCEPIGAKIKIPSPLRGPGISAPSRLAALFLVGAIDKTKPAFRYAKAQVFFTGPPVQAQLARKKYPPPLRVTGLVRPAGFEPATKGL